MPPTINSRAIGPIGFGMASLTHVTNGKALPTGQAIGVLKAALESGANFWNAGEIYGTPEYNSLHLLRAYFTKFPDDAARVVISVKSCFDLRKKQARTDAAGVRECVKRCLEILDAKCRIGVFQAARLDPNVPVEETVSAMAEFIESGEIGGVGLSECSATSIRKSVKAEASLFETAIFTNGVADACQENDIPIVAYSPLSRGFLTGQIRKFEDLPQGDVRHMFPRFQKDVFDENVKLVNAVEKIANREGYATTQVALAWLCAQSRSLDAPIIPIPGTTNESRVHENSKKVTLKEQEVREIWEILAKIEVKGARAPAQFARWLEV